MNILFHLYLSAADEELLVGNFMGDFVKGPLDDTYPPRIRQGLRLHRQIDAFAQKNEHFQASRLRLSPELGLYRGVMVDLFYDHFLARGWDDWSSLPFADYLAQSRRIIDQHLAIMPPPLRKIVPIIFSKYLPAYQSIAGTAEALQRMGERRQRANPLGAGGEELIRHYPGLQDDFSRFTPAVRRFARNFMGDSPLSG